MRVNNQHYRSIWANKTQTSVFIIDQTQLPFSFEIKELKNVAEMENAITDMQVRGAPLIGASAAYGIALAMHEQTNDAYLTEASEKLVATRPTAVNLQWAVNRMHEKLIYMPEDERLSAAWSEAALICDEDVQQNQSIAQNGFALLKKLYEDKPDKTALNVLTHCNAGWLATVDIGTALGPIYAFHDAGLPIHVWVDETRPRNQGANITAWELHHHGVPHTVITDNAGGHLMQKGHVDCCIVGADRIAGNGDVCNKIGTYLKALAAKHNEVPFYVAAPSNTIDHALSDGGEIPIENRPGHELSRIRGQLQSGELLEMNIIDPRHSLENPAFDVTPAELVTQIMTENGLFKPSTP